MKKRLLSILTLTILTISLTGCLGPKPSVQSYDVQPPPEGTDQPYKVEAVVSNIGPGAGEVEVEVNFSNKQTGEPITSEQKEVQLQKDETLHVVIEVDMPESAQDLKPDDIEVEVDAHYPIE
jgi:YbbR domain-containing protein